MVFEASPITPAIGAEITGIDLSKPCSHTDTDRIYQALLDYQVIFFRNQSLTAQLHLDLACSFGNLEPPHPIYPCLEDYPEVMVLDFDGNRPQDTNVWHTDLTFKGTSPFAAILHCKTAPPCGGDTLWASLSAAYDALPEGVKSDIAELRAVNDMGDFRNIFTRGEPDGDATNLAVAHSRLGNAIHPLVKIHPATGRTLLFCNPAFTVHVEGLTAADSARLLGYLFSHLTKPEFQMRFQWHQNDVAIWDNRCTMHYALYDYSPYRRTMHRVAVINDKRCDEALADATHRVA